MERLIRVQDIVGCKKSGIRGYLPISKSAWWAGVSHSVRLIFVSLGYQVWQ